jgi:hypothetical protein
MADDLCASARAVFRPDYYDAVHGVTGAHGSGEPVDGVGAFTGPPFDASKISNYLAAWSGMGAVRPRFSVVR